MYSTSCQNERKHANIHANQHDAILRGDAPQLSPPNKPFTGLTPAQTIEQFAEIDMSQGDYVEIGLSVRQKSPKT